jgi:predicted PhzF superfamily epimerase YddE/YHI9
VKYRYYRYDVFTETRSGGNPLAVLPQADGLGRPSTLLARAEKTGGIVRGTWVGGACVLVSEGLIHVD